MLQSIKCYYIYTSASHKLYANYSTTTNSVTPHFSKITWQYCRVSETSEKKQLWFSGSGDGLVPSEPGTNSNTSLVEAGRASGQNGFSATLPVKVLSW